MSAQASADTGTGGFVLNMDGESGDLYTYDTGMSENFGGAKGKWSPGGVNVDNGDKDLTKGTKVKLSQYLGSLTRGTAGDPASRSANSQPITEQDTFFSTEIKLNQAGYPAVISPSSYEKSYVDTVKDPASVNKDRSTLSSVSQNYLDSISTSFAKGKKPGKIVDGNSLLKNPKLISQQVSDVYSGVPLAIFREPAGHGPRSNENDPAKVTKALDADSELSKYSSAVLKNRFSGDGFLFEGFSEKYNLGSSPKSGDKKIGSARLAQVGEVLSLRAGLELTSTEDKIDPTSDTAEAAALLPGTAQLGIRRIKREILEAQDVLRQLTDEPIKDLNYISPMGESWGNLNNVYDQFSGISNFGMQILALALIAALGVLIAVIYQLFRLFGGGTKEKFGKTDSIGRHKMGSYLGRGSSPDLGSISGIVQAILARKFNIWSLIGVGPTYNELNKCIQKGALAFFGIDGDSFLSGLGSAIAAGAQNPGFDSIIARTISRSFLQIGDYFSDLGKAGPVTGKVKKLIGMIDLLRESKLMRALNVFAQIGDNIVNFTEDPNSPYYVIKDPTDEGSFSTRYLRAGEVLTPARDQSHQVNRILGTTKISWASYRAPDLLIMPTNLGKYLMIDKSLNAPSMSPTVDSGVSRTDINGGNIYALTKPESSRIPTDLRESMERALDAEHFPFYFHDVRTNEITSFHAFLTALTEDFTAQYESSEAFGRVDAIKIYKNTNRKLSFSFIIAALDEADFDTIWLKINKLTTLIYPQFTAGKEIISDDKKFSMTMPFSQMIGASPLVRIRIGDLVQSNYSKFNLARTFGYTNSNSVFNEKTNPNLAPAKTEEQLIKVSKDDAGKYTYRAPNLYITSAGISEYEGVDPGPIGTPYIVFKLSGRSADKPELYKATAQWATINDFADNEFNADILNLQKTSGSHKFIIGKTFLIKPESLIPTEGSRKKILQDAAPADDYANEAAEFMNDTDSGKGNAVSKSFRSAGGRGLAGFIESMHFDWYDKVTWSGFGEQKFAGRRAPKMCKVNITFAPIHDITPGLDHFGFNRAPIYPVGPAYPRGQSKAK